MHAGFAGNPKRIRAGAKSNREALERYERYLDENADVLEKFTTLVAKLNDEGKRVCVTCFERHPDDCHRSILAKRWQKRTGGEVRHIDPGDARLL